MSIEQVYIVDKFDNVIGTTTRKEANEKNLITRATIILLFNSKNEILITKRSKNKRANPELWEIGQGGVVNAGESYQENASRELFEEVGIKRSSKELEYLFDYRFASGTMKYNAKVFSCKTDLFEEEQIKFQDLEIEAGEFISYKELKRKVKTTPKLFTPDSTGFLKEYVKYLKR